MTSRVREPEQARKALRNYRIMAWITGVMLLILCVEMTLKYIVGVGDDVLRWIEWVPFAHGWIYVIYLVTVMMLWSTMRWGMGRLAALVFAGVVPVMSFFVERSVHRQADAEIEAAEARPASDGTAAAPQADA